MHRYRTFITLFLLCCPISAQILHSIKNIQKIDLLPESKWVLKYDENSYERRNPYFVQSVNTMLKYYKCDTLVSMKETLGYDTTAFHYIEQLHKRDILMYRFETCPTYLMKALIENDIPVFIYGEYNTVNISRLGVYSDVVFQYAKPESYRTPSTPVNPETRFITIRQLSMYGKENDKLNLVDTDTSREFRFFYSACVLGTPGFNIDSIFARLHASLDHKSLNFAIPEVKLLTPTNFYLEGKSSYTGKEIQNLNTIQNGIVPRPVKNRKKETTRAFWVLGGTVVVVAIIIVAGVLSIPKKSEPFTPPPRPVG